MRPTPTPTFPSTDRRLARSAAPPAPPADHRMAAQPRAPSSASTATASARRARRWWSAAANRIAATLWHLPYADRLAVKWLLMGFGVAVVLLAEYGLLSLVFTVPQP